MPRNSRSDPGHYKPFIDSFALSLRASGRGERTVETYVDAATWLAGWLRHEHPEIDDWADVTRTHLRTFFVWLREQGYAKSYINQVGRSLQAFWKWLSAEEDMPNLFGDKLRPPPPPRLGEDPPVVIAVEQLAELIKDAERGKDYESRRDAAILRLFASTGCRLSELTNLRIDDVDAHAREATVTGKGNKTRTVKYDHKCALAIDRFLRVRARHKHAYLPALWIGTRRATAMTPSGVRQIIQRRGKKIGLNIHPHLFRHTFAHRWLDEGGAEGDLMELAGWGSPQMLRHYGASARSARARRAYDRVDVMGGV